MKFCGESGCPGIASKGAFCEKHQHVAARTQTIRPPADPWYAKSSWRGKSGIRLWKLRRNPLCEKCGKPASQVHHLDDTWKVTRDWFVFKGGYNGELLQSLCGPCHSEETMQQIKMRGLEGLQCGNQS